MSLVYKIKELTSRKSITLTELERILDFSQGSIRKWDKQPPGIKKLQAVADYFDVTTDYLLGRNQAPKWADKDDLIELDKLLDSNVNMAYNGENLTPEEIQRVKDILTGVFWEYAEKDKKLKK